MKPGMTTCSVLDGRAQVLQLVQDSRPRSVAIPQAHWAGSYYQSPLSEVLVDCGFADIVLDQPGVRPRVRWCLEGVDKLGSRREEPVRVSLDGTSLRYDGQVPRYGLLDELHDELLETNWKPPPS